MARPVAKLLTLFAVLAAVLVVGALLLALHSPPQPDPLPNPNGYDDFVKAGKALQDVDYSSLKGDALRTAISNNAGALNLARTGLSRDSRMPLDYKEIDSAHFRNLPKLKGLAQAFVAEGRLAEAEHRPKDAVQSYVAAMRLGQASTRGGVIIDALVGIAIETLGLAPLERMAPSLDAKDSRDLAAALEEIDSRREPAQVVLQQEHNWCRRTYGLRGEILRLLPSVRKTERGLSARLKAHQQRVEALMISLAAQAYRLDHNQPPTNIEQLVPVYLSSIPLDPLSGTNVSLPRAN